METMVWVDGWQMQCCGTAFSVGGEVSWRLSGPDRDWLAGLLGPATAAGVDAAEEHHGGHSRTATVTAGTVTGISAVHCRYGSRPGSLTLHPVEGSTTLTPVPSADGWTPAAEGGRLVGYLVRLEVAEDR